MNLPFPATPAIDIFGRTEDPLSDSGNWVNGFDLGSTSKFKTDGTYAIHETGTGEDASAYRQDLTIKDGEVWAVAGPGEMILWFRLQSAAFPAIGNGYKIVTWASGGMADIQLRVQEPGTQTTLATFTVFTLTGDVLGARFVGNHIQVFRNGLCVIDYNTTGDVTRVDLPGFLGMSTDPGTSAAPGIDTFGGGPTMSQENVVPVRPDFVMLMPTTGNRKAL